MQQEQRNTIYRNGNKRNAAFELWLNGCNGATEMATALDSMFPEDKPHNRGSTYRWINSFEKSDTQKPTVKIKHIKDNSKAPLRQPQGTAKAIPENTTAIIPENTTTKPIIEEADILPTNSSFRNTETDTMQQAETATETSSAKKQSKNIAMALVAVFLVLLSVSEFYIHEAFFNVFLGRNNATIFWAIAIAAYPLFMVTMRFLLPADWYYDNQARTTLFFLALFEFASVYVVSYINFLKGNRIISIRHLALIDGNEAWLALIPALLFALMMYGTTAFIFKTIND